MLKRKEEEEAQIAFMEDPIKAWVTESYDTMLALMINWKSLSLIWEMGGKKSEKMDRLMQYFRDRDDMFKKIVACSMIDS